MSQDILIEPPIVGFTPGNALTYFNLIPTPDAVNSVVPVIISKLTVTLPVAKVKTMTSVTINWTSSSILYSATINGLPTCKLKYSSQGVVKVGDKSPDYPTPPAAEVIYSDQSLIKSV